MFLGSVDVAKHDRRSDEDSQERLCFNVYTNLTYDSCEDDDDVLSRDLDADESCICKSYLNVSFEGFMAATTMAANNYKDRLQDWYTKKLSFCQWQSKAKLTIYVLLCLQSANSKAFADKNN